jgi:hypothetical protein
MHLEILVEEPSAETALSVLVPRIVPECTFTLHPHQGKPALMEHLPRKLAGYAKWIPDDFRIIVVLDEDRSDCLTLKKRILAMAHRARLPSPLLCRIAVEELEAWFFGDVPALAAAYPGVPPELGAKKKFRNPDAIAGGTWEALERVLQDAGHFSSGLAKITAAKAISNHMNVERNTSRSFQVFRDGLRRIAAPSHQGGHGHTAG